MKIDEFVERLRNGVLVADGAMGSMIYEAAGPQRSFDEVNLTQPEVVFGIHQAYIQAGAQIIETNTFGANRHRLAQIGLGDEVVRINHRAVKIAREAREAAPHEVLIAGSIGPLGLLRQGRTLPDEEIRAIYTEQAAALEERGVDFFLLETFTDLDQLLLAIAAIRSFSALPIVASLTFNEEGTTFGGTPAAEAAWRLAQQPVQAIGANCTLGPQPLLPVLRAMATSGLALSAMPNAGFPQRMGDRIVYPKSSPEYFAAFAREAVETGARLVGGCCGTTPEHIRAIAEAVRHLRPAPTRAARSVQVETPPAQPPAAISRAREPESRLWRKLQSGQFVISVEIDPPKGVALDRIFEQVDRVMASGRVDVVDINSGTLARVGMDAMMLAGALEARGIETIPHLTTRDMNIIGLQATLLGAWSVGGVRNVLALTGDPPSLGDHPETSGVYEVDSIGLVRVLARLNAGTDWAGKQLGGATNFTIGVALNPVAEDLDYEIERFRRKIEAGAHFAMTQPLFDPAYWEAFVEKLGAPPPIPVLVGIWPLTSFKQAVRLHNEVPGMVIPASVLSQLEQAGAAARDCGFALARRLLEWARGKFAGAYLIPPFKRYEEVLELLV
ncbi:MAG: bifunctional homocysteine S-methyltransferase/methylenetetrahydrofolate reductase [Acidobacteriia bacterium]|jgi:homocysteine S-methyltransferase|nr:bifunctional homocysteine S-methyltransferase/methylenetetrahydrofolate reductase [Terriglobia bacterium]